MTKPYKFRVAVHSYFRVTNKDSEKRDFLNNKINNPKFNYVGEVSVDEIRRRIELVKSDEAAVFRLKLVAASIVVRNESDNKLAEFREANLKLYKPTNIKYVKAILWSMYLHVNESNIQIWNEISQRINIHNLDDSYVGPSEDIFNLYKKYFQKYITLPDSKSSVFDALTGLIESTGLNEKGWKVRILAGNEHARTFQGAKTIHIGKDYDVRTPSAARRIAVHEVLGHALRGEQGSMEESEGFAILLEQLTKINFSYSRAYRYLAVALGWGVMGSPMTFREVHEVLWRLMVIYSKYSEQNAKKYAFDECFRAFRGGRPDIAGAVILKDAVYFQSNVNMWAELSKNVMTYDEFIECIEGKRKVLL